MIRLRQVVMAEPVISEVRVLVESIPQPESMQVEWDQAVAGLVQRLVRPTHPVAEGLADIVNA
jgi:hypothetical protein